MASTSPYSYEDFAESVKFKSRYRLDINSQRFIEFILKTSEKRTVPLAKGTTLWRAQIGCNKRMTQKYSDDPENPGDWKEPTPYSLKRMVPLKRLAAEGRINPKGIRYLYLATEPETCIAEVRPSLGSKVTVAEFELVRDLKVVDCTYRTTKAHLWEMMGHRPLPYRREGHAWDQINMAFLRPVEKSDDVADYAPTQVLAEYFRDYGFHGIKYGSKRNKAGKNIALFKVSDARPLKAAVYRVTDIPVIAKPE